MRVFKTKQKLSGSFKYRKWSEWTTGDYMVGKYQGKSDTLDKYKKYNFRFQVLGSNCLEVDSTYALNHNAVLEKICDKLTVGDLIELRYGGKGVQTKGENAGSEYHILEVDLVEEDNGDMDL